MLLRAVLGGGNASTQQVVLIGPQSVRITFITLDSVALLSSPLNLYCILSGGNSGSYTSPIQTWVSGYPISI